MRPEIFFLYVLLSCAGIEVSVMKMVNYFLSTFTFLPSDSRLSSCLRCVSQLCSYEIWLNWRVLFLVDECRGAGADPNTARLSPLGSTWSSLLAESSIWWFLMCPRRWRWRSRENTTWPKRHWLRTRYKTNFPIKQLCICHCHVWCYPTLVKHQSLICSILQLKSVKSDHHFNWDDIINNSSSRMQTTKCCLLSQNHNWPLSKFSLLQSFFFVFSVFGEKHDACRGDRWPAAAWIKSIKSAVGWLQSCKAAGNTRGTWQSAQLVSVTPTTSFTDLHERSTRTAQNHFGFVQNWLSNPQNWMRGFHWISERYQPDSDSDIY